MQIGQIWKKRHKPQCEADTVRYCATFHTVLASLLSLLRLARIHWYTHRMAHCPSHHGRNVGSFTSSPAGKLRHFPSPKLDLESVLLDLLYFLPGFVSAGGFIMTESVLVCISLKGLSLSFVKFIAASFLSICKTLPYQFFGYKNQSICS